jgi:effector-binding domain-containing protein
VARLVHAGGYDQLGEAWGRLGAWIAGQGLTPGADLWEVYVTGPSPDTDPADLRTELFWAVQ